MAQDNYALLTRTGRLKEAQRIAGQSVPAITHMAFGDADRSPTGGETALGHEVHRAALTGYGIEPGQTAAFFDCYVPAAIGGFVVREIGLFDAAGDLIAIGRRSPGLPKVAPENGGGDDLTFRMDVFFDDLETLVVQVSPIAGLTADNLDLYLHPNNHPLEGAPIAAPSGSPIERGQWLIAPNPTGIWAGKANQIARYRGGAWRYETPRAGRVVTYWTGTRLVTLRFDGTSWGEWLAKETAAGPVQLATLPKVLAGTDADSAVPPAHLKTMLDQRSSAYAVLAHAESAGVNAGNAPVANAWFTRKTNTVVADPQEIVALANDQITLQPGRYLFQAYVVGEAVQRHLARLYNVTDAVAVDYGTTANSNDAGSSDLINSYSIIFTEIVIPAASGPKVYRIEQRVDQVGLDGQTYGLGLANSYGVPNRYTLVTLQKVV